MHGSRWALACWGRLAVGQRRVGHGSCWHGWRQQQQRRASLMVVVWGRRSLGSKHSSTLLAIHDDGAHGRRSPPWRRRCGVTAPHSLPFGVGVSRRKPRSGFGSTMAASSALFLCWEHCFGDLAWRSFCVPLVLAAVLAWSSGDYARRRG